MLRRTPGTLIVERIGLSVRQGTTRETATARSGPRRSHDMSSSPLGFKLISKLRDTIACSTNTVVEKVLQVSSLFAEPILSQLPSPMGGNLKKWQLTTFNQFASNSLNARSASDIIRSYLPVGFNKNWVACLMEQTNTRWDT